MLRVLYVIKKTEVSSQGFSCWWNNLRTDLERNLRPPLLECKRKTPRAHAQNKNMEEKERKKNYPSWVIQVFSNGGRQTTAWQNRELQRKTWKAHILQENKRKESMGKKFFWRMRLFLLNTITWSLWLLLVIQCFSISQKYPVEYYQPNTYYIYIYIMADLLNRLTCSKGQDVSRMLVKSGRPEKPESPQ